MKKLAMGVMAAFLMMGTFAVVHMPAAAAADNSTVELHGAYCGRGGHCLSDGDSDSRDGRGHGCYGGHGRNWNSQQ